MAQCFRKLSSRLASFANARAPVINLDRQHANHGKHPLLKKLLCTQQLPAATVEFKGKASSVVSNNVQYHGTVGRYEPLEKCKQKKRLGIGLHEPTINKTLENNSSATIKGLFFDGIPFGNGIKWNNSFSRISSVDRMSLVGTVVSSTHHFKILCAKYSTSTSQKVPTVEPGSGLPRPDQLQYVFDKLADQLPKFFIQVPDFTFYHSRMILVDTSNGTEIQGLVHYVKLISSYRIAGHMKYAYVKMEVLKMTSHPEDGSIKVRWRIKGVTAMAMIRHFCKLRPWSFRRSLKEMEKWNDGMFTFFVGDDGLIHKVILDNIESDKEEKYYETEKTPLPAKVAAKMSGPAIQEPPAPK